MKGIKSNLRAGRAQEERKFGDPISASSLSILMQHSIGEPDIHLSMAIAPCFPQS